MAEKKDCNECIGELAEFIEQEYGPAFLGGFVGTDTGRASMAELIIATHGSNPEFMERMKALVKPGGDYNHPARISAVKEALVCIGLCAGIIVRNASGTREGANA